MSFNARHEFTGPAAQYAFTFGYLEEAHVKAYVAGVEDTSRTLQNQNPASGGEVVLSVTPGASDEVVIVRETPSGALVDFASAAMLTEADLDTANLQSLYVAEEADDVADQANTTAAASTATVTAAEAAALAAQAAAELAQTNAETAETNAETAETNAAASEAAAAASEAAAAASAAALANPLNFQGTHDASGGTAPSSPQIGQIYRITVAGTINTVDYAVGDWIAYNEASQWVKIDNTDPEAVPVAGGTMTGDLSLPNLNYTGYASFDVHSGGSSGLSQTVDLSNGDYQTFTLDNDTTFTLPNPSAGKGYSMTLKLTQDGTGGRAPTFEQTDTTAAVWMSEAFDFAGMAASAKVLVSVTHDGTDLIIAASGVV